MKFDFPRLIGDIAVNLNQTLLDPISDACRFEWDDITVHLYHHEENGQEMVISTYTMGPVPKEAEEEILPKLLEANYLWVGTEYSTISIDPNSKNVLICDKVNVENVQADDMTERLSLLHSCALYWKEKISEAAKEAGLDSIPANIADNEMMLKI